MTAEKNGGNFGSQGQQPQNYFSNLNGISPEELKKEAGFQPLENQKALRIGSRIFVQYDREGRIKGGIVKVIEKYGKPYNAIVYPVMEALYVSEEKLKTIRENGKAVKPNMLITIATAEDFCRGEFRTLYYPQTAPLVLKYQLVRFLRNEFLAINTIVKLLKEGKPLMLSYYGNNPAIFHKRKMFEVGLLQKLPRWQELDIARNIYQFVRAIYSKALKDINTGVHIITQKILDDAYQAAFGGELFENYLKLREERLKEFTLDEPTANQGVPIEESYQEETQPDMGVAFDDDSYENGEDDLDELKGLDDLL